MKFGDSQSIAAWGPRVIKSLHARKDIVLCLGTCVKNQGYTNSDFKHLEKNFAIALSCGLPLWDTLPDAKSV